MPLTSTWPYLRCHVGLEEGVTLSLCCSIVYYCNSALRYEQLLRDQALILLSLALCGRAAFEQNSNNL